MSERIEITPGGEHNYTVTLRDAGNTTRHEISVPRTLTTELGLGPDDDERLVRASFEFLLERERPASILSRFDLDIIGHYFPEYVATVRHRIERSAP
jgi:hypothetical protein